MSALALLSDLQRRFNGPIPEAELAAVHAGSANGAQLAAAEGELSFAREMVLRQIRKVIRPRRVMGSLTEGMVSDLRLYIRNYRAFQLQIRVLKAMVRGEDLGRRCAERVANGGPRADAFMSAISGDELSQAAAE